MDNIRFFLCHSHTDKEKASKLKSFFKLYFGIECFLAHEDIDFSENWNNEIVKNLKGSNVFLVLVSAKANISAYVNQEIGIALGLNKTIIPMMIEDEIPAGFISIIQACKCRGFTEVDLLNVTTSISLFLLKKPPNDGYTENAINSIIFAFSISNSYATSRIIMKLLMTIDKDLKFSDGHLKLIVAAIKSNNQIYDELFVLPKFTSLLHDKYKININQK